MASNQPDPSTMSADDLKTHIQSAEQKAAGGDPAPAQTPEEVELSLGEGLAVYKGSDYEEVAKKVAAGKIEADRTITQLKAQLEERERLLEAQHSKPAARSKKATGEREPFDNEEYWKLMETDPVAAQEMMDRYRFGLGEEDSMQDRWNYIEATVNFVNEASAVTTFQERCKDFPADKEATETLFKRLEAKGRPMTADAMESTYYELKREGAITPAEAKPEPSPTVKLPGPGERPTGPPGPPPNLDGGGHTPSDSIASGEEYTMDVEDLKKKILELERAQT